MIFAGLAGCGDVNDTGMNNTTTGYTTNQGQGAGTATGFGFDNGRYPEGVYPHTRDFQGTRGYREGRGSTGFGNGQGTIGFGAGQGNGFGARAGQGNYQVGPSTRNNNVGHGAGYVTEERNFGSAFDYQTGNTTPRQGLRGQNNAGGFNVRGNRDYRGFGRGITGNDRPGMVDENGLLNGFDNRGQVGRQHRGFNRGTEGFNHGTGRDYGNLNGGTGRNNGTQGLNRGTGRTGINAQNNTGAYFDSEDGRLATQINDRIGGDNIRDSRVIVHGNDVLIGVDADDTDGIDDDVRNRVGNLAGDRNVHVVTDRNQYRGLRDMDDRLRAGDAFEEIGATFNDMLDDLGNAVQRPFERSR